MEASGAASVVASVDAGSALGRFLSVAPPLTAIGCFLVPLATIRRIARARDTLGVPVLPFLTMGVQSCVWLLYGLMLAMPTIIAPNVVGVCLGAAFTFIYDRNSRGSGRRMLRTQYVASASVLVLVLFIAHSLGPEEAPDVVGGIAAVGSVCFAFSPLAAILTVLRTRSLESMPLATSIIFFFNGMAWTAFGVLVAGKTAIWAPNSLGAFAGALQLAVHAYFALPGTASGSRTGFGPGAKPTSKSDVDVDVDGSGAGDGGAGIQLGPTRASESASRAPPASAAEDSRHAGAPSLYSPFVAGEAQVDVNLTGTYSP